MDYLEFLADYLHCNYISDLRYASMKPEQAQELLRQPDDRFTLAQYNEVLSYLTDQRAEPCGTCAEARQKIVDILTNRQPTLF